MTKKSANGWEAITSSSSPLLHKWVVPDTGRHLILRRGSGGFNLVHFALWFHEEIERLDRGVWDEWGWAYREIRGATALSNHSSGTAIDLNATRHPLGVPTLDTFTRGQVDRIRARLHNRYQDTLRWGGDYRNRPDAMHVEQNVDLREAERLARKLMRTNLGKAVLAANPGQKKVILS